MRNLLVLSAFLVLGACMATGDTQDRAEAERTCKDWVAKGVYKGPYEVCVADTFRDYQTIRRVAVAPPAAPQTAYGSTPTVNAPTEQAASAPQQQIYYPTRCQTGPAGLGTYQTTCR